MRRHKFGPNAKQTVPRRANVTTSDSYNSAIEVVTRDVLRPFDPTYDRVCDMLCNNAGLIIPWWARASLSIH